MWEKAIFIKAAVLFLVSVLIVSLVPFQNAQVGAAPCVQIQQVGFSKPSPFPAGDSVKFGVTIINTCSSPQTVSVKCYIDGKLWDSGNISISGGQSTTLFTDNYWTATAGSHTLTCTAGDVSLSRNFTVNSGNQTPTYCVIIAVINSVEIRNEQGWPPITIYATVEQLISGGHPPNVGDKVKIEAWGYGKTNSSIDTPLNKGDRIEVRGSPGMLIDVFVLPDYIKKISVSPNRPDLTVTQVGFNKSPPFAVGDSIYFIAEIANKGNADAVGFGVDVYLDGKPFDSGSGYSRAAQTSDVMRAEYAWTASAGTHTIKWVVDAANNVNESNENNNVGERSFTVEGPKKWMLSTSTNPTEGGQINPGGGTYDDGQQITINAYPSTGWEFISWSGDASDSSKSITITMNSDKTVTANFQKQSAPNGKDVKIIVSGGMQEYKTSSDLNVFARGSSLNIEFSENIKNIGNLNREFELLNWLDTNHDMEIDETDLWVKRWEFSSTEVKISKNLPNNLPIGLYRLGLKGTKYQSNNFFIIFLSGGNNNEKNTYWKSTVTGYRGNKWAKFSIVTGHYNKDVVQCMASASFGTSSSPIPDTEEQAIKNFQDWLHEVISLKNVDIPSSVPDLINKIKTGKQVEGDCAVFSSFLVSLSRTAGLTTREITGKGLNWPHIVFAHNWVEVYYGNKWQCWDPSFNKRFGNDYKQLTDYHNVWWGFPLQGGVEDEVGVSRTSDY